MQSIGEMQQAAIAQVRSQPADASARMKLFRVFCVTGQWERAVTQLDTASGLDASLAMSSLLYKQAIACERFREAVFAGRRTPVVLGEPQPWLGWMIEALRSEPQRAEALRAQALDAAAACPGTLDGAPFEWLADADPRLGPVLEAFIDGKYYWLPFERISALAMEPPDDLLDLVWARVELTLGNGGTKHVMVPARYPGSETGSDDAIRLARRTEWIGSEEAGYRGLGQREWVTDRGETGLLDVRQVQFDAPAGSTDGGTPISGTPAGA
ncbi:MAG: type VI secretion system accessory protein TagJ [Lautropia sp.]